MSTKKASIALLVAVLVHDGLEEPEREVKFAPPRRWPFDLAWRRLLLAVEVEGGIWLKGSQQSRHTRGGGYQDDCIKYSAAAIMGWMVIRVTYGMIEDGSAIDLIEAAYARRLEQLMRGELPPLCPIPTCLLPKARVKQVYAPTRAPRRSQATPRFARASQARQAGATAMLSQSGQAARLVLLR